jgi:hypothetical protein
LSNVKLKKSLKKRSCASTVDSALAPKAVTSPSVEQDLVSFCSGLVCSTMPLVVVLRLMVQ